jgi:predicted nuclease of predicted toxin-antitoxin system
MLTTGNITNNQLITLFETNFKTIINLLEENKVVELNNNQLIVHF